MVNSDPQHPPGEPAPEILEERIWIDGCFDFFHHGEHRKTLLMASIASQYAHHG